jgi:hypothetical protein
MSVLYCMMFTVTIDRDEDGAWVAECPSVPDHKEVAKGTLRNLIRSSGLTVDAFLDLTK